MSEADTVVVRFGVGSFPPLRLPLGSRLVQHLTVENSPILFGCRTGICATCLVRVETLGATALDPPSATEAELLGIVFPGEGNARLACQLILTGDLRVAPLGGAGLDRA